MQMNQPPRILIVEEDGIIARHLQVVLKKCGYQIQAVVGSGEDALRSVEQELPNLALVDLQLSGKLDGIQTAEQFQNHHQIPIVYLTAFGGDPLLQRAKLTNPFGFVSKPFEERHLQATVELALQKDRFERELRASREHYLAVVSQASEGIVVIAWNTRHVIEANRAFQSLVGLAQTDILGHPLHHILGISTDLLPDIVLENLNDHQQRILDMEFHRSDGALIYLDITISQIDISGERLICAMTRDVTERHLADQELRRMHSNLEELVRQRTAELAHANRQLHALLDGIPDMAWIKDRDGYFVAVNQPLADSCGQLSQQVLGKTDLDFFPADLADSYRSDDQQVVNSGRMMKIEERFVNVTGVESWIETIKVPVFNDQGQVMGTAGIAREITQRKQAEAVLRRSQLELEQMVSTRTRALEELNAQLRSEIFERRQAERANLSSVERYRYIYNKTPSMLHSIDAHGNLVSVSDYWLEALNYTREEVLGRAYTDFIAPEDHTYVSQLILPTFFRIGVCKDVPLKILKKSGESIDVLLSAVSERDESGKILRSLSVFVDITERVRAGQQLQTQLRRMASLRAVETSITARFDLHATLDTLLEQVLVQLGADATCVLLFNPRTQVLEDAADRGFRTGMIKSTRLRLGEGLAGKAAQERRLVSATNLGSHMEDQQRYVPYLQSEGFVSYYGMPLIVKGIVKGVLEIYQRSLLNPPHEWLEFLEVLGRQTAIAIDNVTLFEEQQRANQKLTEAFDATIEGWSRGLELRDRITQKHTTEVTRLTLALAQYLGELSDERDHLRRGAILHDIGKMGIPDKILIKEGSLSPKEWEVMRLHPVYAFEWLSPIDFLRPALDIPYCHHEHWDGSGYPRGLKGNQIPLAARIFTVVDVYEALSSDRPYRGAMSEAEVRRYLLDQSGAIFEPRIVTAFLRMLEEK
jgi:PAS domain S-box-containing protein